MISSYDQPSKTEQMARSRRRRRRAAPPMRICVPGGIWVYDFIDASSHSSNQTFAIHQLGVENRRSGSAANRVVAEDPELVIEDVARHDRPDHHSHSQPPIAIQARLWTLNVIFQNDGR